MIPRVFSLIDLSIAAGDEEEEAMGEIGPELVK
jgi:hypothetical protein